MTYCARCGDDEAATDHADCRRRLALEPPRYCTECGRRMVVQVTPTSWTARCSRHGERRPTAAGPPNRAGSAVDLAAADAAHVWHPYAATPSAHPPYVVDSAYGVRLRLADGREVVDGMSSWWAAIHGYRHPALDAAATEQLGRMSHVMFGGLTHRPAVRLAERLAQITPDPLQHVFFSDSGSVAVEVAIKMSVQYWHARGRARKKRLMTIRGGYHGDTLGAMSVCDPVNGMHTLFTGLLPQQLFVPQPPPGIGRDVDPAWVAEVERTLRDHADDVAAVVVEPVVQGAGGMQFHDPGYVRELRRLCDRYEALLVLDEIATGFGRTGELFAADLAGVAPDVMCLGKALTGGYVSMAATLCTTDVARTISDNEPHAFMHGPTFMANPLAASIANASIDQLLTTDWRAAVARIERELRDGLEPARSLPGVRDVRVLGAIGVVQLDDDVDVAAATEAALGQGVWLRPFRDLVYTMPPYVCTDADVTTIVDGVLAAVKAATA